MCTDLSAALAKFDGLPWDQQVHTLKYVMEILDDDEGRDLVLDNLRQICIVTCAAMVSLRSMVVRVGISTLSALFSCLGQAMDSELDFLMHPVVKKVSDGGNRFIRDEAIELLHVISEAIAPASLCKSLLDYVLSKNDSIRKIMTELIAKCLQRSADKILSSRNLATRIITILATLLGDKLAAVRENAKSSLIVIKNSLGRAKFLKFSSTTLSSAVLSAIDLADRQGRNRCVRSAPQVRKVKAVALQPLMSSRRPDSISRTSSASSDDSICTLFEETVSLRQTTSSSVFNKKFCVEPALTSFKAISDEECRRRRTANCIVDGKLQRTHPIPNTPVYQASKISSNTQRRPTYDSDRAQRERTLAPRIFELSLLHSRMKPCRNDAEARNRRSSDMFVSGRSAGEPLISTADLGQRRSSYQA